MLSEWVERAGKVAGRWALKRVGGTWPHAALMLVSSERVFYRKLGFRNTLSTSVKEKEGTHYKEDTHLIDDGLLEVGEREVGLRVPPATLPLPK